MKTGKKVKDFKNKVIFTFEGKDYDYAGIYNLIKDLDYKKVGKDMDYLVKEVSVNGEKAICLFLQESASDEDWKSNLTFWPKSTKAYKGWKNKLKFHKGFFEEYQSGRDNILAEIKELLSDDVKKIFVTGWSNGASTAPIACEDIYFHFGIKPIFIGYEGAQPCANRHTRNVIQNILADGSISFVYGMDIVPRMPPFYPKFKQIIYYFKVKEKFPSLIRKFISIFTKTAYYHCNVDKAINEFMN